MVATEKMEWKVRRKKKSKNGGPLVSLPVNRPSAGADYLQRQLLAQFRTENVQNQNKIGLNL